jgi:hypothetical protein
MRLASYVQIPRNITDFRATQPVIKLVPLKLHSASTFHIPSQSAQQCFHNGPRVVLSPLKLSVQRINSFRIHQLNKRRRMHPCIEQCNTKK